MLLARAGGYRLEWKIYGHDGPADLKQRLLAAGFEAEAVESLMVLPVSEETLAAFRAPAVDIRRVRDREGLEHVAAISREIGRTNVEREQPILRKRGFERLTDTQPFVYASVLNCTSRRGC